MRPLSFFFFFLTIPPPPRSTLFPYTTLFRSREESLESSNISRQENRRLSVTNDRDETARFRGARHPVDRKSTRLNSSHLGISYAVFCLKKKKKIKTIYTNIEKETTRQSSIDK